MPKSAMRKYSIEFEIAKNKYNTLMGVGLSKSNNLGVGNSESQIKKEYNLALRKYRLAYDKILNKSKTPNISLITNENKTIIEEALQFWEGTRLKTHAWCIMSNHFHWIVSVFEKDENRKPVYLQDILHSIKLFTARNININEKRKGQLWVHESFDTTIRNERHFMNVVKYTINNPVSAGMVKDWQDWPATFVESELKENLTSVKGS